MFNQSFRISRHYRIRMSPDSPYRTHVDGSIIDDEADHPGHRFEQDILSLGRTALSSWRQVSWLHCTTSSRSDVLLWDMMTAPDRRPPPLHVSQQASHTKLNTTFHQHPTVVSKKPDVSLCVCYGMIRQNTFNDIYILNMLVLTKHVRPYLGFLWAILS